MYMILSSIRVSFLSNIIVNPVISVVVASSSTTPAFQRISSKTLWVSSAVSSSSNSKYPIVTGGGIIRFASTKMSTTSDFENKAKDFWDERYGQSQDDYTFGIEPNDFLKEIYETVFSKVFVREKRGANVKVLMLGEGEGRNGVYLAKNGSYDVTAVDISNVGLEKANKLAQMNGVTITTIQEDLKTYDFGVEKWDIIISISCHLPPMIRHKVLHEDICKSLKVGGYFLLEGYTPEQLNYKTGGPPTADMMYTSKILDEAFPVDSSPLETLKNVEIVRDVVEGTAHTGKASVVQYLGQKKNMA